MTSQSWWWWITDIKHFCQLWTVLHVFCSITAKFSANRVCQVKHVHTYPHHHPIHLFYPSTSFSSVSSSFCRASSSFLFFWKRFFRFFQELPSSNYLRQISKNCLRLGSPFDSPICKFCTTRQTDTMVGCSGSAGPAPDFCCTNRPVRPGCGKKVEAGIYYRNTMYKY